MSARILSTFLNRSGLAKSRELPETVYKAQWENANFDIMFVSVLVLAASIATLGLAANSEATIVGAMLISPLMRPIMSLAYGVATGNESLKRKALLTLFGGIVITLITSSAVENVLSLYEPTSMILDRIKPSLVDLAVAVAAGAAGTLAATRKDISGALPGVAIAVSLVPPLCVTGIGWSVGSAAMALGSLTLFTTNLVAIVLVAATIFVIEGMGGFQKSLGSLAIIILSIGGLIYFLSGTQSQMWQEDRAHDVIEDHLRERYAAERIAHPGDLNRVIVMDYPDHVYVFAELKALPGKLTEVELAMLHDRLTNALGVAVNLKLLVVHANEMTLYTKSLPEGVTVDYGMDILVPKD